MQNTFSQSGNDSKWFLPKIIFQNRYVALETPSRPPPLHGKCHLKFPFWFSAPFPYLKCVGQKGNNYLQLSVQPSPNWHQCPPLSDLAPSLPSASPPVLFGFENTERSIFDKYDQSCFQSFTSAVDMDPLSKSFRPLLLCTFILALLNPLQYSKLYIWESLALSILTRLPCASEKVSSLAPAHINNAWCIFSVLNVYDWNIYWKQKEVIACKKHKRKIPPCFSLSIWDLSNKTFQDKNHLSNFKTNIQSYSCSKVLKCKTHFTAGHLFESHSCKLLWSWMWDF